MKKLFILICIVVITSSTLISQQKFLPDLSGSFLGQPLPGDKPELFAPGIVATQYHEHSAVTFSPDQKEMLWTSRVMDNYIYRYPKTILSTKNVNGSWTVPDFTHYWGDLPVDEAVYSPDGKRIYLSVILPRKDDSDPGTKYDIWYIEKKSGAWSEPKKVGPNVNTENHEMQASVAANYNLYYVGHLEGVKNNYGLFCSKYINSEYQKPELMGGNINSEHVEWTPFIAPDESYYIFTSLRPGGYGRGDFYICFRQDDGSWSEAINMGETVNSEYNERYTSVSPDGRFMFFMTDTVNDKLLNNEYESFRDIQELYHQPQNGWSDIYWIGTEFIDELKNRVLK